MTKKEKADYQSTTNYSHKVQRNGAKVVTSQAPIFAVQRPLEGITTGRRLVPWEPMVLGTPCFIIGPELLRYIRK